VTVLVHRSFLHRCFGSSAPSHHSTRLSHLQLVRQAKSCLDLLHLDHMIQYHVSCAMSSFIITCVSFATSPSHFHLHGICCSQTYTCGLITCVSHINTISLSKVVTQLPKPNKDLSCVLSVSWHERACVDLMRRGCIRSCSRESGRHLTVEVMSVTIEIARPKLNVEATWRDRSDRTLVECVRSS
jgi:hypothetical protein